MASTGNTFPTVGASVDRASATAWTNPGNVVSDNATDTTAAVPTDYLVTSGYGFAIPADAVIRGVTVRVEASETGTGNSNYVPQLHSDTTPTLIGSAKSAVTVNGTTKVISTNGGIADLWGAALTPAIVNSAGFGVSIWSTDATNTLAIDYVTISIEYTQVLNACDSRQYFRFRRNLTNRRLRVAAQPEHTPATPALSPDVALPGGLVTRGIRGHRLIGGAWIAAMAPVQVSAVPPAAWFAEPVRRRHSSRGASVGDESAISAQATIALPDELFPAWDVTTSTRRRSTVRRLLRVEDLHWQYIAPEVAAILVVPKAKVIRFERRLQTPLALEVYPPPTGPPDFYPAWAAPAPNRVTQTRQHQKLLEQPSYPRTPTDEGYPGHLPTGFLRRRETTRSLQRLKINDAYPATPAVPTAEGYPGYLPDGFHRRRETQRRLLTVELDNYPPATPVVNVDVALDAGFVTRASHVRRLLTAPWSPAMVTGVATPPGSGSQGYPAFLLTGYHFRKATSRQLLREPPPPVYPATPVAPFAYAAVIAPKIKRRKPSRSGFVVTSATYGAPIITRYPSFVPTGYHFRKATERRLQKVPAVPVYPYNPPTLNGTAAAITPAKVFRRYGSSSALLGATTAISAAPSPTPPTPPVIAALVLNKALRRRRTSSGVFYVDSVVVSAPPAVVEYPAFKPMGFHRRQETERRLQRLAFAPVYPSAPATAQGYPARLAVGFHKRSETERKLQHALAAPFYAPPPATAQGYPAYLPVGYHRRSETQRILQLPLFPPEGVGPPRLVGTIPDMLFVVNIAITPVDLSVYFYDVDPLTFTEIGTFPTGLSVDSAGILSGTPTVLGVSTPLQVRAADAYDTVDSNVFSITISPLPTGGKLLWALGLGLGH